MLNKCHYYAQIASLLCFITINAPINGLPQDGGEAGNPREFDFVKLYLGRDFDIHNDPLAGLKI